MDFFRRLLENYEVKGDKPIPWAHFVDRLLRHGAVAGLLIVASLGMGMSGYMLFEHLSFVDAFMNASMILGGMGPVATIASTGGKVFAGLYALYSGLVFLIVAGLLLAPVVHRVLHRFHWEISEGSDSETQK